jgi:hypothetical protein
MLFEQAVAHQKRDAAFANFDRRNHSHAPRAPLAEPLYSDRGLRFCDHVTG